MECYAFVGYSSFKVISSHRYSTMNLCIVLVIILCKKIVRG